MDTLGRDILTLTLFTPMNDLSIRTIDTPDHVITLDYREGFYPFKANFIYLHLFFIIDPHSLNFLPIYNSVWDNL